MANVTWSPRGNSSSWTVNTNWTGTGLQPTPNDNVTISASPYPYISGTGFAHNLTLSSTVVTVTISGPNATVDSSLSISGSITNNGTISLDPGANPHSATFEFDLSGQLTQSQLSGGGTILMSDDAQNSIVSGPNGVALENLDNTIEGAGQFGNGSAIELDNHGIIEATGVNNQLNINLTQPSTNEGQIFAAANSAGLTFAGTTSIDSSNGGTVSAQGGNVYLSGTSTLTGGTMQTSGGGLFVTVGFGSTIAGGSSGLTNAGSIHIVDATGLTLQGNIANNLAILLLSTGDRTYIYCNSVNLSGPGVVTLSDDSHNMVTGATTGTPTLTITANLISGAGFIGGNGLSVNNIGGVITATGTNNPLIIGLGNGKTLTNSGILSATGPQPLEIDNTLVSGTAGGQIIANAPGAVVQLIAAHLSGGTLSTVGAGAEIEAVGQSSVLDGTLTNVVNNGTVSIDAGGTLTLWGTTKNNGTIVLAGSSGNSSTLAGYFLTGATLTGNGTVSLGSSTANSINGEGASFTNQNNMISGSGSLSDMTLTNGGTIKATSLSAALTLSTGTTITNNGVLQADDGALNVTDAVTGTGSALIDGGGIVTFSAAVAENVVFQGLGELVVSQVYGGTIFGATFGDNIDLKFQAFQAGDKCVWQQNGTTGTLNLETSEGMVLKGQKQNYESGGQEFESLRARGKLASDKCCHAD